MRCKCLGTCHPLSCNQRGTWEQDRGRKDAVASRPCPAPDSAEHAHPSRHLGSTDDPVKGGL